MIKIFRQVRKTLVMQNKAEAYFKYAIGEIILVVIGILIALQINNWQEEKRNILLEKRYLNDLMADLKKDSLNLDRLYLEASLVSAAKDSIYNIVNQPDYELDSLPMYFRRQWNSYRIFSPSTSTIEEMKSSSHLEIIRDNDLRKQIVDIYYQYELFLQDESLFHQATRETMDLAKANLPNISHPNNQEIKALLKDQRFTNSIRVNFAKGRLESINNISAKCHQLMRTLKNY